MLCLHCSCNGFRSSTSPSVIRKHYHEFRGGGLRARDQRRSSTATGEGMGVRCQDKRWWWSVDHTPRDLFKYLIDDHGFCTVSSPCIYRAYIYKTQSRPSVCLRLSYAVSSYSAVEIPAWRLPLPHPLPSFSSLGRCASALRHGIHLPPPWSRLISCRSRT
jgi:hypothetical protein